MKGRDEIKELFSEKLGNYEAKVNPELWTNIASQIGTATATTAASTGISLLTKWIIGASIASAVAVTAVIIVNNSGEAVSHEISKVENVAENISSIDNNLEIEEKEIDKANVVEQISVPEVNNVIEKEIEPIEKEGMAQEGNHVAVQPEAPIVIKNPVIEAEEIEIKEPNVPIDVDPVSKDEQELVVEDIVIDHQTPDKPEATYKIGKLPNTFSPNRDGVHDIFFVESEGLTDFNIVILDAKNNVVFKSNDPEFKWDGNDLSGYPVPDGSNVIYYITARDKSGSPVNRGSMLTINR